MENISKKIQILINLYKAKNLSKAELLNKELIIAHPKVVILYNILGLILTDQNKTDKAIECYEQGIRIRPDYAMIYNNLGSSYQLKNNYTEAENNFIKSIDLDNKKPEPHNNLGNLYLALNKHQKAIVSFKNAETIDPKFFISHYNLGVVYHLRTELELAAYHYAQAIAYNPHERYSQAWTDLQHLQGDYNPLDTLMDRSVESAGKRPPPEDALLQPKT